MRSNYKQESIKLKSKKGITLIALVITIVVLLILAGISINAVIGENGIFNNAKDAKTETNKETAYEKVQVQVLGAINGNGEYDPDIAKENIERYLGATVEKNEGDGSLAINYNGYFLEVDKEGNSSIIEESQLEPPAAPASNYVISNGILDHEKFGIYHTRNEKGRQASNYYDLWCSFRSTYGVIYSKEQIDFNKVKKVKAHIEICTDGGGVVGTVTLGLQKELTTDNTFDEKLSVEKSANSYLETDIELPTNELRGNYYLKLCIAHDDVVSDMTTSVHLYSLTFE